MIFLVSWGLLLAYIYSVYLNTWNLYGDLPPLTALENPKQDLASELYSADGVLLGKYFRYNRTPVTYEGLSPNLVHALIATEDCRFSHHAGIDLKGLLRALTLSIVLRKNKGGGSTISQQLAKNLFKMRSGQRPGKLSGVPLLRTVVLKTKEWIVAVQLERAYTKSEIITMYFNTVGFGSHAFGIEVASRTFFNTLPRHLNAEQAALLVGLLRAPSYYSPVRHPKRARSRRNIVLDQMHKYGYIRSDQHQKACNTPIQLVYKAQDHNVGLATYFRAVVRDVLLKWTKQHGYDLFGDGLRIYTTLDSRLQKHAEEAVYAHMPVLQQQFDQHWRDQDPWVDSDGNALPDFIESAVKRTSYYKRLVQVHDGDMEAVQVDLNTPVPTTLFSWQGEKNDILSPVEALKYNKKVLHTGMMAMDPHTGHVKAWVGGINYKHFQYDHVLQGARQPGSAFKPIVYAAAIDNGYMPWHEAIDSPVTFKLEQGDTWTPRNWNRRYTGQRMTLRQAMARSVNSITACLMKQLGPPLVVEYAKRLGIESPLEAVPALCLGSSDVSVYELVSAYGTFMNRGEWTKPIYITHIEDKDGRILERFVPQKREAIGEKTAYLMIHMLKGTLEEEGGACRGLSQALRQGNEVCGKTGTTSNHSDGWFVGMARNLVAGVWVGAEDRCIHFRSFGLGQGARLARPIWEKFMLSIYADADLDYHKGDLLTYPPPQDLYIPPSSKPSTPNPTETGSEPGSSPMPSVEDIL